MMIKYKYRHGDTGTTGWYQTDSADFKKLWKNKVFRDGMFWCVVDVGNGNYFIYSNAVHHWYKSKKRNWF